MRATWFERAEGTVCNAGKKSRCRTKLDLSCEKPSSISEARAFFSWLEGNRHLSSLYLDGCFLGSVVGSAEMLARALRVNQHLRALHLWGNGLREPGAKCLADALTINQTLRKLLLGGNDIGDEGARHLAASLRENVGLHMLSLVNNGIGDEGACCLAAAFSANQTLQKLLLTSADTEDYREMDSLHLSKNCITDAGILRSIGESLRRNSEARSQLTISGSESAGRLTLPAPGVSASDGLASGPCSPARSSHACSSPISGTKDVHGIGKSPSLPRLAWDGDTYTQAPPRPGLLLPFETHNLLCNWSPVDSAKIDTLVEVLKHDVWPVPDVSIPGDLPTALGLDGDFFDLGCGDGRVVLKVCEAFPSHRCFGIDLNSELISQAQRSASKRCLETSSRCEFIVGDLANVRLDNAAAVFVYLPASALSYVVHRVLPQAGLRQGAVIFSADGPLPRQAKAYRSLVPCRNSLPAWAEKRGVHCYKWVSDCGFAAPVQTPLHAYVWRMPCRDAP